MPKYFNSREQQLYCEAFASLLLIEVLCANLINAGVLPDRFSRNGKKKASLCEIFINIQNRSARRYAKYYAWQK